MMRNSKDHVFGFFSFFFHFFFHGSCLVFMQPIFRTQSRLAVSIGSSAWTGSSRWRWSGRTAVRERAIFGVWENWLKPCWPYRCPTGRRYVPRRSTITSVWMPSRTWPFTNASAGRMPSFSLKCCGQGPSLPSTSALVSPTVKCYKKHRFKKSKETMTLQKDLHVVFFKNFLNGITPRNASQRTRETSSPWGRWSEKLTVI